MTDFETKLLTVLGKEKLSAYSLRRLMRNYLSASDVDRLLMRLVQENPLTFEEGAFKRIVDSNNPANWEQA